MSDLSKLDLSKLIQQSYSGITLLDRKLEVLYRTPSASNITGWANADLKGISMMDMVHANDKVPLRDLLDSILGCPGSLQTITFRLKHHEGHYIWLECTFINRIEEPDLNAIVCNFIDVTEKKLNEDLLQQTLEELSAYKKALDEAAIVAITDQKGSIKHVNQNFSRISGYTTEELIGNDHRIINSGHHDKEFMRELWRTIAQGRIWKGELRNRAKNGDIYWVDTSIVPFLDASGKPYQYVAIRSDITERKLREIELKKTTQSLINLLETISDGYISLDRELCCTYANRQVGEILGIDANKLIGRNIWEILPGAIGSETYHAILTAINEDRYVRNEEHFERLGLWQENRIYPTADGLSIFIRDITQSKIEEQHLRLLESAIANTTDAVLITENDPINEPGPRIVYVNHAFTEMTGYMAREVLERSPRFLQGERTDRSELDRMRQLLEKGENFESTLINYNKDNEEYWVNISIAPVHDQYGKVSHYVSTQRDVTTKVTEEQQRALITAVSMIFNTNNGLTETLTRILERLVQFGDLLTAEAWLISSDQQRIDLKARYLRDEEAEAFYNVGSKIESFKIGEGLPGSVWRSGELAHWRHIATHPGFVRRDGAMASGLSTAYGIPLKVGTRVIGVLVLATDKDEKLKNRYQSFFNKFGTHLSSELKRKQLEDELGQIFNFVPDVICVVDADRKFRNANPAMCELLGYTQDELAKLKVDDIIHPEDLHSSQERMAAFTQDQDASLYFEDRYLTRSGKVKWLAWTATAGREPGVLFCVAKDITEKKELENLLNKATALACIGGWEVDMITDTVYWSPITREIHGVDDEFVPRLDIGLRFYKEGADRDHITELFTAVVERGIQMDTEAQIVTAKNETKWVRVIGEAEYVNKKCVRVYGSFQDIDTRKRAQLAAQYALEEKDTILDSIGDGFFAVDRNWIVTYWNNSAAELMSLPKENVIGNNLWQLFPAAVQAASYQMYHEAVEKKLPVHFNDYYEPLHTWYDVSAYPAADGLSIYFKDVTERMNYIKAIEEQNRKFNEISWMQSHVVRAPLSRILGLVDLLKNISMNESDHDVVLGYIVESAQELDGVIKNITDLSATGDR